MLIKRIITGLILLIAFPLFLFNTSPEAFSWGTYFLLIISAWEWSRLIGLTSLFKRLMLVLIYAILIHNFFWWMLWINIYSLFVVWPIWWLFAFFVILLYSKGRALWAKKVWVGALMGLPALGSAYAGFYFLRMWDSRPTIILYFILLIAAADSFAYFTGRLIGKHKLLPALSPNKTWEGFFGGLVASALVAVAAGIGYQMPLKKLSIFVLISLIAVLFSVVGDLFISLLKRQQNLKDTGSILPGHGGLLDRLDGINAAVSIFALGLMIMMMLGMK